ncbi:MAG: DNA polymerase III subunit beta [Bacteroidia bacterium]|nr:DNA polymerase III subunit beta [Bacteroidia bacterium]
MKFSVSSAEILSSIQLAGGAIGTNPVLPILEDFLFELNGDILTITATDLETSIITGLDVSGEEDGKIAVPARILIDTVKALPEQPLTFEVNEETNGITITSSYGSYRLAGDDGSDFPDLPTPDNVQEVELSSSVIARGISKTIFSTANDELRPAMSGVYVSFEADTVTFVATDGHKLVKYTFTTGKSTAMASFIAPKKSLSLVKNAMIEGEVVSVAFNKSNVFFSSGGTQYICRLIDAKFPDYNAVIPVNNPNEMVIGRMDFLSSLRRNAIYANKTTNQVVLNITENALEISSQDLDFSNEAKEQLSCTYSGTPIIIGFNARFLIEMLGVLESDEVQLDLSEPNNAGILSPMTENEGEKIIMLVMPVMMKR